MDNDDIRQRFGPHSSPKSFHDLLRYRIGEFGRWQILNILLYFIVFHTNHQEMTTFIAMQPRHHCRSPQDFERLFNWTSDQRISLLIPSKSADDPPMIGQNYQPCLAYNFHRNVTTSLLSASSNFSEAIAVRDRWLASEGVYNGTSAHLPARLVTACPNGMAFESEDLAFRRTITEEYNLVCGDSWKLSFTSVAYSAGMGVGVVFTGYVSDALGRKSVGVVFLLIGTLISGLTILSPNYWVFWVLRFLGAVFVEGASATGYTLVAELLTARNRNLFGFLDTVFVRVVQCAELAAMAYFTQDWRWLTLAISARSLLVFIYLGAVGESPLWLISRNKLEAATKTINGAIRLNHCAKADERFVSVDLLRSLVPHGATNHSHRRSVRAKINFWAPFRQLFKWPLMFRMTMVAMSVWMLTVGSFFGSMYYAVKLEGNAYLIFFLGGVITLPSALLQYLVFRWLSRPRALALMLALSGSANLVAALVMALAPDNPTVSLLATVFATVGLGLIGSVFGMLYIYTPEIFPTGVRAMGLGLCSAAGRIGGAFTHYVVTLDGHVGWRPLPLLLYGAFCSMAAILSFLLIDTRHMALFNTVEELEEGLRKEKGTQEIGMTTAEEKEEEAKSLKNC